MATDPAQYAAILDEVVAHGDDQPGAAPPTGPGGVCPHGGLRSGDRGISGSAEPTTEPFPPTLALSRAAQGGAALRRKSASGGGLYADRGSRESSLVSAQQLAGKELSYNNLLDLDSALAMVRPFDEPAASVIKHNNPCGAAVADSLAEAARAALDGDPLSAFGSVLGFNRPVDAATAEVLAEPGRFIEAIVAPDFEPAAFEILTTRPKWKANVRLLKVGRLDDATPASQWRQIAGGLLVQDADNRPDPEAEWQVVTDTPPEAELMPALRFAWAVVRHVKSNAIVLAKTGRCAAWAPGR